MTTSGSRGRAAITHYEVRERIASPFGKFALVDVRIETGRTHQIRVHMSSIGHPVVGDSLYRAPKELRRPTALPKTSTKATSRGASRPEATQPPSVLALNRNFLHAAAVEFTHPRSGEPLSFRAPLPPGLTQFLEQIRG
jgi:23S rRNA pseudouridine1911/1915/1917 synthase